MRVSYKHGRRTRNKGAGLVNKLINKLPIELHLPGYNYCGPGTKLETRLRRGDVGVNKLDEACKLHDIAYGKSSNLRERHKADEILVKTALDRVRSSDAKFKEKLASLAVAGAIKAKVKFGMGHKKTFRKKQKNKVKPIKKRSIGGKMSFANAVKVARLALTKNKKKNLRSAVYTALGAVKKIRKRVQYPRRRVIPIPKTGGSIPLVPLFSVLETLGSLGGSAAGVIKTINEAKLARDKLIEDIRHKNALKTRSIGSGLYIKPYKNGCGLDIGSKN